MIHTDTLKLLGISCALKIVAAAWRIPAGQIDTFIRIFALRSIRKIGEARSIRLLINPISSIRYWEFDYSLKHLASLNDQSILDVSSPRFFGLYVAHTYPKVRYQMINPDKNDIQETLQYKNAMSGVESFRADVADAASLPYKSNTFDYVISISVIEHIAGTNDTKAVKEMLRVLRPGGKLILTTHVMKKGRDEYRQTDQYSLGLKKKKGRYFFQRVYDEKTLRERIVLPLGVKPENMEIIGEKTNGWFDEYIRRWILHKLKVIVFDPWYMLTKFAGYPSIESLKGMGVIGIVFRKP